MKSNAPSLDRAHGGLDVAVAGDHDHRQLPGAESRMLAARASMPSISGIQMSTITSRGLLAARAARRRARARPRPRARDSPRRPARRARCSECSRLVIHDQDRFCHRRILTPSRSLRARRSARACRFHRELDNEAGCRCGSLSLHADEAVDDRRRWSTRWRDRAPSRPPWSRSTAPKSRARSGRRCRRRCRRPRARTTPSARSIARPDARCVAASPCVGARASQRRDRVVEHVDHARA